MDDNGTLDYNEVQLYLKEYAYPELTLSEETLIEIYRGIDTNHDNQISKDEMVTFVTQLMM